MKRKKTQQTRILSFKKTNKQKTTNKNPNKQNKNEIKTKTKNVS